MMGVPAMIEVNIYNYVKLSNGSVGIISNVAWLRTERLFKVESVNQNQRHIEAYILESDITRVASVEEFLSHYEQDSFSTIDELHFEGGSSYFD